MTKADVFRFSDIHNKGHNLSIRVSIKWSQFAKPVLLHFYSKGIYSMGTLTVLFKGPTAVQRTHIQSVFSVLIQMRICSFLTVPADTQQENILSSHPHSPIPSTLRPTGISEMFLLEGQRQTKGVLGVKPLPLYTGCQFSCTPCFIYSGSCELCWYSWTALLWTHDCSPGGHWTFAAGGGYTGVLKIRVWNEFFKN